MPKYPDIHVQLTGENGNAFSILAKVDKAMRRAGVIDAERSNYRAQAMAGDYNHLLKTTMDWVEVG